MSATFSTKLADSSPPRAGSTALRHGECHRGVDRIARDLGWKTTRDLYDMVSSA
jgi:hypothetical protein